MSSHEECRSKVCVMCSRKAYRCLSKKQITLIQKFVDKDYNAANPDYPNGICNGCMLLLGKKEKDIEVSLTIVQSYKCDTTKSLCSSGPTCQCTICKIAHSNMNEIKASKKKRGRPKSAAEKYT